MPIKPYSNVCALSKACQMLEPRWTLPILNVIWGGYTRFNDIRRAVGGVSPSVLSKRLAEMEANGLVERIEDKVKGTVDYVRTEKAIALEDAMDALARWAQCHIEAEIALTGLDVSNMMWWYRQAIKSSELPARRVVIRFKFTDESGALSKYWLLHEPGSELELCIDPPSDEVDLFIETTKKSLLAIYHGRSCFSREQEAGRLFMTGDAVLQRSIETWTPRSFWADIDGVLPLKAAE
jgi:DNA-binding HxlR family transcriptional regulator